MPITGTDIQFRLVGLPAARRDAIRDAPKTYPFEHGA
jgi:hypothetical protein